MDTVNAVAGANRPGPAPAVGVIQMRAEELSTGAGRLRNAAGAAEGLAAASRDAAALAASAGCPPAASAIESFLQRWSYGLGHMSGDLRSLASLLSRALQSYQDVDRAVGEGP